MKEKAAQWREKALEMEEGLTDLRLEHEELQERLKNVPIPEHLETTLRELRRELRELQRQKDKGELDHERQLLRRDAENDRLKASLEDYKDRYKEIRDDNKDLRHSITRTVPGT